MRIILVRKKDNGAILAISRFNRSDLNQVTILEQLGFVCYTERLSKEIYDSRTVMNGDWILWSESVTFVRRAMIDQVIEPPLAKYGHDPRTIEQLWRDGNGRTI